MKVKRGDRTQGHENQEMYVREARLSRDEPKKSSHRGNTGKGAVMDDDGMSESQMETLITARSLNNMNQLPKSHS